MAEERNYFETLNGINVNDKTEKKNGLTYLSWAYAWGELKKKYPMSYYTIYENKDGWNYFTDGKTCWVKTGVTIVNGDMKIEHIEMLPIMNNYNKSISVDNVTSFDVNKAIQRSLTKAVARHGLGLYVYAGEDLPEDNTQDTKEEKLNKLFKPFTQTQAGQLKQLNITLEKVATYLKKDITELSYTDVQNIIDRKMKKAGTQNA